LQKDDLRRFGDKQLTPAGQQQQQQTAGRPGLVLGAILENTELNNGHAAGAGGRKRSQGATETGGVRHDREFLGMEYFLNIDFSNLG
jgi:hypothetical protein